MRDIIRLDKFLSFWIILYSFGYIFKIFPYNPIILLSIAMVFFIFAMIIILYYKNKNSLSLYFFIINFVKLPLFAIIYYQNNNITHFDILFTIYFIVCYIIYIELIDEYIYCIYNDLIHFFINYCNGRSYSQLFYEKIKMST
jgi:hypothetical protein